MNFGLQIIESLNAVELDGDEDREIEIKRGGFFARLFDPDPTLPLWQKTAKKTIKVPRYKPAIFRVMDKLIVHPSLAPEIKKIVTSGTAKSYRW